MSAPQPYRTLSGLSAVMILACALFFVTFGLTIAPRFAGMFQDFGGELPFLTRVALRPVSAIAALLFLAAGAGGGIARPVERPLILSLTAGGGVALAMVFMLALYLPVFAIAEAIK